MKKRLFRLMSLALCAVMLASIPACGITGYKVTGEIEDGKLVVWYSPRYTQICTDTNWSDNAYLYTDFPDDIEMVSFTSEDEFNTSLAEKLASGEGPDMVLAYADEISPKMLDSEMFADLDPFLDYEDTQTSYHDLINNGEANVSGTDFSTMVIKREDLIMNLINQARYNGKLYYMPIGIGVDTLQGNKENLKYGGLDLYNNKYTPAEFLAALKKEKSIEVNRQTYPEFAPLPNIEYIFKNFIDFKKKTTRMGEDITYEYFCTYVQSIIDEKKRLFNFLESVRTKSGHMSSLSDPIHYTLYYVDHSPLWSGVNHSSEISGIYQIIGVLGAYNNQDDLTLSDAAQPIMPSECGAKYYISMNSTMVAAITATSKHPNKAFAYIKAYLSEPYHENNMASFMSPNIYTYTAYLKKNGYSDAQIKKIFEDINNGAYIWAWTDSKIEKMFHDMLYDTVDGEDVLKETLPTRDQWNELKNKIETYLNE